jgi:excisionase family DNA binding protein
MDYTVGGVPVAEIIRTAESFPWAGRDTVVPMRDNAPPVVPIDGKIAYSVKSAAQLLDVHPRMVERLIERDELASFKIGRARRITRDALIAFVRRCHEAA